MSLQGKITSPPTTKNNTQHTGAETFDYIRDIRSRHIDDRVGSPQSYFSMLPQTEAHPGHQIFYRLTKYIVTASRQLFTHPPTHPRKVSVPSSFPVFPPPIISCIHYRRRFRAAASRLTTKDISPFSWPRFMSSIACPRYACVVKRDKQENDGRQGAHVRKLSELVCFAIAHVFSRAVEGNQISNLFGHAPLHNTTTTEVRWRREKDLRLDRSQSFLQ